MSENKKLKNSDESNENAKTLLAELMLQYALKGTFWEEFFKVSSGTISAWKGRDPKDPEVIQVMRLLLQVDGKKRNEVANALRNKQLTKESVIAIKNAATTLSNPILSSAATMLGVGAFGALGIVVGAVLADWLGEKKK
jgi:hypothetical protein